MRFGLCLLLGLYSLGMISYTLSEMLSADAACTHCFKGETAFAGGTGPHGEASTPTNRYVPVGYVGGTGPNSFAGADAAKIAGAIDTAANAWNTTVAEDNTSTIPYTVRQTRSANDVKVYVGLVDQVPGNPNACAGIDVTVDKNGNVTGAVMVLKKGAFQNLSQDQVAKMIEHELGHFLGLADIGDSHTGQCASIMDKAKDTSCTVTNTISKGDVTTVLTHVNNNSKCDRKRQGGLNPLGGGGIEPPPLPFLYPQVCYYYWTEVPYYSEGGSYLYSDYYLDDIICL